MSHAVRIHGTGDPSVLQFEDVNCSEPGPGEALVEQSAIGARNVSLESRQTTGSTLLLP